MRNAIFSGLGGIMSIIAAGPPAALLDLDAPAVLFATAAQEPIDRVERVPSIPAVTSGVAEER